MKKIFFSVLLFPLWMNAQTVNLTGTWEGSGGGASYVKMVLVHTGDSCYGYTYDSGPGFCRANFAGKFSQGKLLLTGAGVSMIEKTFEHSLARYRLHYSASGQTSWLSGGIRPKSAAMQILSLGIGAPVSLRRITSAVDTTPFMAAKLNHPRHTATNSPDTATLAKTNLPKPVETATDSVLVNSPPNDTLLHTANKNTRQPKLIETIVTNADTLKMTLYDNGEMDNDTVTIFLDNTILLNRCLVSTAGKQLDVPISTDGLPHTLTLFADNLGSIPPNTAFLVIYAGKRRYELRASFDLKTNAEIIVQYKKE